MTDINNVSGPPPKPTLWNNPQVRAVFFQGLVIAIVAAFIAYIANNAFQNMKDLGIASGFEFLGEEAGFSIQMSLIEYTETDTYARAFLVGLLNTILVASLGILACTIIGFVVGVARLSENWLVARVATAYVEITRNIPLLLQIFLWYFGVLAAMPHPRESASLLDTIFLNNRGLYVPRPETQPEFWIIPGTLIATIVGILLLRGWARRRRERTGQTFPIGLTALIAIPAIPAIATAFVWIIFGTPISWDYPALSGFNFRGGLVLIPELVALWLALSIYTAGFVAEIVRAGILSVSKGQTEAAKALGLPRGRTLQLIIIPQAMRVIVPPLTNQYLSLTKNSSLAAAIGYPELVSVFAGTVLNQTGQAVEVITITMLVYLSISLMISLVMNWYNRRIALVER